MFQTAKVTIKVIQRSLTFVPFDRSHMIYHTFIVTVVDRTLTYLTAYLLT